MTTMTTKKTAAPSAAQRQILAWLDGEHDLTPEFVFKAYILPDRQGAGQFFSSLATAEAALKYWPWSGDQPRRVLVPGAGIGHLIRPLDHRRLDLAGPSNALEVDAFEFEPECVEIGRRLLPWVTWRDQNVFLALADLAGRYDRVLCNPPLGIQRGLAPGQDNSVTGARRSEHLFLELAILALKPGGQAVVLGPAAFPERWPAPLRLWLEQQARLERRVGPLPGVTGIELYAYYFTRLAGSLPAVEVTVLARGHRFAGDRQAPPASQVHHFRRGQLLPRSSAVAPHPFNLWLTGQQQSPPDVEN